MLDSSPAPQVATEQPAAAPADAVTLLRARARDLEIRLQTSIEQRIQLKAIVDASPPLENLGRGQRVQVASVRQQVDRLDVQIINLQTELKQVNLQIEAAGSAPATPLPSPAPEAAATVPPSPRPATALNDNVMMLAGGFGLLVLAPLAIALAWRILRRGPSRSELAESNERVRRLEETVDSLVLDMERITEGQRFLTATLTDSSRKSAVPAPGRETP